MKTVIAGRIKKAILLNAITLALWPMQGAAESFNSGLLIGHSADMDWDNKALVVAPGLYEMDIYIDDEWKGKFSIHTGDESDPTLKIKKREALQLGISGLDGLKKVNDDDYVDISAILHGGTYKLNTGEMRLDLLIPQAWVMRNDRNWVAPERWERGVNGLYTSYNVNAWTMKDKGPGGSRNDSVFLGLNSGLNLWGWHFIDNSTLQRDSHGKSRWDTSSRYVERPIVALTSRASVGDMYSSSDYFDNISFRGVRLVKDKQMLPDKDQTYMPVIRGTAMASAVVTVRQDDRVISQISVPPGPFAIRDLMPTGSRKELEVEVRYGPGSAETFTVPFATMSSMLRPGTDDFMLNLGRVRLRGVDDNTAFFQGDYSRGINNYWTLFSGTTLSKDYQSLLAGSAFSIPTLGSVSANVEQSRYKLKGTQRSGEKYSLAWSKYLPTRTNITLASWYYRTRDYATFQDYILDHRNQDVLPRSSRGSRQAFSLSLSQPLGENGGRLSIDGWLRQYRDSRPDTRQYSLGYSNSFRSMFYTASVGRSEFTSGSGNNATRRSENTFNVALTVPLSLFERPASVHARSHFKDGKYTSSGVGLSSSTSLVDYSLELAHDHNYHTRSADLYTSWKTQFAHLNVGVTEASDYRQASAGATGSVLAWRGGVLTSPETGDNFVIIDAPGVEGARVNSSDETRTNRRGQALVSGAVAYRMNDYYLEQDGTRADNAEVLGNIAHVAPYAGSISRVTYRTDTRRLFIFDLQRVDGTPLGFGSPIYDAKGTELGFVGQGSQAFVKADTPPAVLIVDKKQRCQVSRPSTSSVNVCRPLGNTGK